MSADSGVLVLLRDFLYHTVDAVIGLHWAIKTVLVCGLLLLIGYRYLTATHGFFKEIGINGPEPGLLGLFADYMKKGLKALDGELIRKYGKIVGGFHGRSPVYIIADPDFVREIGVKHFNKFANRIAPDFLPESVVFKDALNGTRGNHWKFLRSTLSPAFTGGRMREIVPLIQQCSESLAQAMDREGEAGQKDLDMNGIFSRYTMGAIASTAYGVEIDTLSDPDNVFVQQGTALLTNRWRLIFAVTVCSLFPFMTKILSWTEFKILPPDASKFFVDAAKSAIEQRKEETGPSRRDFLQLMLNSHKLDTDTKEEDPDTLLDLEKIKKRGLTDNEVIANAVIFLLAGFDTTQITLTFMAYLLATNQDCQDKLIDEVDTVLQGKSPDWDSVQRLKYLDNFLNETLRLYPPAARTSRHVEEDVEIKGVKFKKGTDVHFSIIGLHTDPEFWPNPDKFDPDRFLPENLPDKFSYVYLPFGVGPRNCIGKRLGQLEVKMAIISILQKFKLMTSSQTEIPPPISEGAGLSRPKNPVFLRAVRRT